MQKLQPIKDARKAKALRAHFFPSKVKSKVSKRKKIEENKRKQEDSTSILNLFQKTVDMGGLFDYNNTCRFR